MSSVDYRDIKRKNSQFSFTDTIAGFESNQAWKQGYTDLKTGKKTAESYLWNALSAIGDELGQIVYENVQDYVDNVANIDTCHIKPLVSMCKELGIDYSILNVDEIPPEIIDLMNVLSINKAYLLEPSRALLADKVRRAILQACRNTNNTGLYDADYVNGSIRLTYNDIEPD